MSKSDNRLNIRLIPGDREIIDWLRDRWRTSADVPYQSTIYRECLHRTYHAERAKTDAEKGGKS